MARNTLNVQVPPEGVFDVLADPRFLAVWVVGASTVRGVDGDWPQPGSVLHHTQLAVFRDITRVLAADPPRRLVLEARSRPLGIFHVDIQLERQAGGTRIVLDEHATGGIASALPRFLSDALIRARNRAGIRRLRDLAEIGSRSARA